MDVVNGEEAEGFDNIFSDSIELVIKILYYDTRDRYNII